MKRVTRAWMRGAGPLAVLKLLEERPMYGYELAEALDRVSDGALSMGHSTLYPMLYKLEREGLVSQDRRAVEGGRERKYYQLTSAGREVLSRRADEWAGLVEAMQKLGLT